MEHEYSRAEVDGKRYRFFYDELHETVGSYGYETEAETKAAEDEELANLESGEWVVLWCQVSEPCEHAKHCEQCDGRVVTDSLHGIVVESSYTPERLVADFF